MRLLKCLLGILVLAGLVACGGGGGSANTGGSSGGNTIGTAGLALELRDANGTRTNAVGASGVTARATVRDASGLAVANKLVVFTGDVQLVKFNPPSGIVLTDSSGVASLQVSPASATNSGAGSLNASAVVGTATVAAALDYQLSASNVVLSAVDVGIGSLAAFGNRPVSVSATVSGAAATNTPVQVTFQASCGTVNPAVVTTDNTGKAATTYTASNIACAGSNVSISASAPGAAVVQGVISVQAPLATNMEFVSATPQLLYLKDSVGPTQSQLVFRVLDFTGTPLQNQSVLVSLVTNSVTGVSLGTLGNTTPVTLSSDSSGQISVPIFSGSVPTSVQVRVALASNANVAATSNQLRIASGRPVQRASSIGVSILAIEGFTVENETTNITMSLADRQGNPVPDGTQVNFTSESGVLLPPSCIVTDGKSACTVSLRAQGTRPGNGRVSVLAYVPGEEDFVDANANNVYDAGEAFTDLGNAYRDDNENGTFDLGEFSVPRSGAASCSGGFLGRANTCDSAWGTVDVRQQAEVVFSRSTGTVVVTPNGTTGVSVQIQDSNGNGMAVGSKIEVAVDSPLAASTCTATTDIDKIPNISGPFIFSVALKNCVSTEKISVKVTSPVSLSVSTGEGTLP